MSRQERGAVPGRGVALLFGAATALLAIYAGQRLTAPRPVREADGSAGADRGEAMQPAPTVSASATQLAFAAAEHQFAALHRFGVETAIPAALTDRASVTALRSHYESTFIHEGTIEIDTNGTIKEVVEYLRAADVIQAKAAALGYGPPPSQTVPIASVPGGYVGRYGGHDIYAAAH